MAETHIVFNDQLEKFGERFIAGTAPIPPGIERSAEIQKRQTLAILFEQFLLFDRIAIKIDKDSLPLHFLISEIGINKVEELLEHGIIIPVLWTPMILTSLGRQMPDGSIDRSTVLGQPPLISGRLGDTESDPEKNLDKLLRRFNLHKDRIKIFKKKVIPKFIFPDYKIAEHSAEIVVDAYKNNRLSDLGLEAIKTPEQLDYIERAKLADIGNQVLETTVLAEKRYRSYGNYSYFNLTNDAIKNIESAYHVSENTSKIFSIENIVNIQQLVYEGSIPFDRVFDLRYMKNIKTYRKWINSISVNTDAKSISKEYIDELAGKNKFFESTGGKFLKNVGMLGVGTGIGAAVAALPGAITGAVVGKVAEFGLGLFDSYILDGILKGWNPRMFVNEMRYEIEDAKNK